MKEREVASTQISIHVPQEAWREFRARYKDDDETDALFNQRAEKPAARAVIRRMAQDLVDTKSFAVRPNGELAPKGD